MYRLCVYILFICITIDATLAQTKCKQKCLYGGTCRDNGACDCAPGYAGSFCQHDVNECASDGVCGRDRNNKDIGVCINTFGSYYCKCHPGYKHDTDEGQGRKLCIDINECLTDNGGCVNRRCENTDGSHYCAPCPPLPQGWLEINKTHCIDIDECELGVCLNANCTNTNGSYHCECKPGFRLRDLDDPDTCDDIDECKENPEQCGLGDGIQCFNKQGTWGCDCPRGYQRVINHGEFCRDVDECDPKINLNSCAHNCVNTHGGYACSCYAGYELAKNQHDCENINECKQNGGDGPCVNSKCEDHLGSFFCACNPGYQQVNQTHCFIST